MNKYVFRINGMGFHLFKHELLMVYAILQLKTEGSVRLHAIKALRELKNIGLYDAKQIVDFIAERATFPLIEKAIAKLAEAKEKQ